MPCREQFNQATLAAAYERRTDKIKPDAAEYEAAKVRGWASRLGGQTGGQVVGQLDFQQAPGGPANSRPCVGMGVIVCSFFPHPCLCLLPLPLPLPLLLLQASDPEFYRTADSLLYGAAGKVPEANIDRMVAELNDK